MLLRSHWFSFGHTQHFIWSQAAMFGCEISLLPRDPSLKIKDKSTEASFNFRLKTQDESES